MLRARSRRDERRHRQRLPRERWDGSADGGCRTASGESNRTSKVQERPRRDYRRRKAELERKGRSSGDGSEELVAGGPMFLRPRF